MGDSEGIDQFRTTYTSALSIPGISPTDKPERHIQRVRYLSSALSDLSNLITEEMLSEAPGELADVAFKTLERTRDDVGRLITRYIETPLGDELHAAITRETEESPPLEDLASSVGALFDAAQQVHEKLSPEKKMRPGSILKALKQSRQLVDRLKRGNAANAQQVAQAFMVAVNENRASYLSVQTDDYDSTASFREVVNGLADASRRQAFTVLRDADIGQMQANLEMRLRSEQTVRPYRINLLRDHLQDKELAETNLTFAVPQALEHADIMLTTEVGRFEHIFVYLRGEDGFDLRSYDSGAYQTLSEVRAFLAKISPKVNPLFKPFNVKREALENQLEAANKDLTFFTREEESFKRFAKITLGQGVLGKTEFEELAKDYGSNGRGLYASHAYVNRTEFKGVYAIAERLRLEVLDAIKKQMRDATQRIDTFIQAHFQEDTELPKEDERTIKTLEEFVTYVRAEASKERKQSDRDLYVLVSSMPEFERLSQTIAPQTELLSARTRLNRLERLSFPELKYDQLLQTHHDASDELEKYVASLPVKISSNEIVRKKTAKVREIWAKRLQAQAVEHIARRNLYDPSTLTRSDLERQITALDALLSMMPKSDVLEIERSRYHGALIKKATEVNERKHFVLDTNVLMSDPSVFYRLGEDNDIVIPQEVLVELDSLKVRPGDVGEHAREADRVLRSIMESGPGDPEAFALSKRITIFDQYASLWRKLVKGEPGSSSELKFEELQRGIAARPDSYIIRAAARYSVKAKGSTVLISKDTNMRLQAKGLGVKPQDYFNEVLVSEEREAYHGYREIHLSPALLADLRKMKLAQGVRDNILDLARDPAYAKGAVSQAERPLEENEYVFAMNPDMPEEMTILRHVDGELVPMLFRDVEVQTFPLIYLKNHPGEHVVKGFSPRNAHQFAAFDLLINPEIPTVTLEGDSGTGKTAIAVAAGIYVLSQGQLKMMYYTKPNIPLDAEVGILPGDLKAKQEPHVMPFLNHHKTLSKIMGAGAPYEIHPLSLMRGMDIQYGWRILDEAQNATVGWVKLFGSRHCDPSKTVLIGDPKQIDNEALRGSHGFAHVRLAFPGQREYGHMTLQTLSQRGRTAWLYENVLPYTPSVRIRDPWRVRT